MTPNAELDVMYLPVALVPRVLVLGPSIELGYHVWCRFAKLDYKLGLISLLVLLFILLFGLFLFDLDSLWAFPLVLGLLFFSSRILFIVVIRLVRIRGPWGGAA